MTETSKKSSMEVDSESRDYIYDCTQTNVVGSSGESSSEHHDYTKITRPILMTMTTIK